MLSYILLAIGFILLFAGAGWLVDGASSLARRLHVSDLVIGLTVVAFGTSTPELFVNLSASLQGNAAIAIGNIVGSNIFNILVILGISAIIYPLAVTRGTVWKEIPLTLLAVILLVIMGNDQWIDHSGFSALTRIDGLIFISFFIIFIYYTFGIAKTMPGTIPQTPARQRGLYLSCFLVLLGLVCLCIGGNWVVHGAIVLAAKLGLSQSVIGLTLVAAGTSLSELATSTMAAYRKNAEIAVGNIVGSNIFNVFFILGTSSLIKPLPLAKTDNIDIGVAILASLLLFLAMFTGRRRLLDRWEGVIFLSVYVAYMIYLIHRG